MLYAPAETFFRRCHAPDAFVAATPATMPLLAPLTRAVDIFRPFDYFRFAYAI